MAFEAGVDVRDRLVIEPHLRFQPADVGNLAAAHGPPLSRGVDDVVVNEIPFLHRLAEGGKDPIRHRNLLDARAHGLENAGFQDHLRIGGNGLRRLFPGPLDIGQEIVLGAPQAEAPSGILYAQALEHADVVIQVAPAVEHALHRNRAGEEILQDLP